MSTIPDLVQLHDSRPGVRTLLQVSVREASPAPLALEDPSAQRLEDSQLSTLNSQPILDFIASTATLDRYAEVIEPAGWRLEAYRRNPVFQNAHNYGDILFTLGKALVTEVRSSNNLREAPGRLSTLNSLSADLSAVALAKAEALAKADQPSTYLFQRIQFATEVNPVARIAYGLYKGGFLNAVSVGFIPLRWEDAQGSEHTSGRARSPNGPLPGRLGEAALPSDQREAPGALSTLNLQPSTTWRRRYLEQELLEVSAVAIPANPDALALGVKSGAVRMSDLQATLDLLRALVADDAGRARSPSGPDSQPPVRRPVRHSLGEGGSPGEGGSTFNFQLLQLARELRRVMRKA